MAPLALTHEAWFSTKLWQVSYLGGAETESTLLRECVHPSSLLWVPQRGTSAPEGVGDGVSGLRPKWFWSVA